MMSITYFIIVRNPELLYSEVDVKKYDSIIATSKQMSILLILFITKA